MVQPIGSLDSVALSWSNCVVAVPQGGPPFSGLGRSFEAGSANHTGHQTCLTSTLDRSKVTGLMGEDIEWSRTAERCQVPDGSKCGLMRGPRCLCCVTKTSTSPKQVKYIAGAYCHSSTFWRWLSTDEASSIGSQASVRCRSELRVIYGTARRQA